MDDEIEVVAEVAGAPKSHGPTNHQYNNNPSNPHGPGQVNAGVFKVPQSRRVLEEERRQEIQSAKQALQQCVRLHEELEDEELDLAQEDAAELHMNKIQQLEEKIIALQNEISKHEKALLCGTTIARPIADNDIPKIIKIEGLAQRTMEMVTRMVRERRGMETLMSLEELHDIWYEKATKKADSVSASSTSDLMEYVEEDPADSDPSLRAKLAANHSEHVQRMERVEKHLSNIIEAGTIDDDDDGDGDGEDDDIIYEDSVSQGQQQQQQQPQQQRPQTALKPSQNSAFGGNTVVIE